MDSLKEPIFDDMVIGNSNRTACQLCHKAVYEEMPNEDYKMQENIRNNWKFILKRIKEEYRVSDLSFDLWIVPLKIENMSNGVLRLNFDGERVMCLFIKDKFGPMISAVVSELIGRDIRVEVCNKA